MKTAYQLWKEAKEQNLSKEDFKKFLIKHGVIVKKEKGRILTKIVDAKTPNNTKVKTIKKFCSCCNCEFDLM